MSRSLALAILPTLLLAQEPGLDDLKDLQDLLKQPVISSASKRLQRLKEAPVDATVLSGEDLRRLGYRTLSEALDGVLGFRTVRDRAYDNLAVRGLQIVGDLNTRVLILLDGHTLNSSDSLAGSMIGEDFGIPLERVERIEIIRGPASALYGNTAFMGMVNVITRPPGGRAEGALEGQSRGGFGGWGRAGWTGSGATWDIMASGWQRKGTALDFPELGVGTLPADLDREERQSAYLRAKGKDWSLAGYAMSNLRRLASAPYSSVIGDASNHYKDSLVFGEFKAEPRFGKVETLVRVYADHYVFSDVFSYDGVRDPAFTQPFSERDPSQGQGLEVQARFPVSGSQMLTVGSEQKWGQLRIEGINEGSPFGGRVDSRSGNSYLQMDSTLNEWAQLVLGIQHASHRITLAESFVSGQTTSFQPSTHQDWTPRFALILNPTSMDILKLLYGGGYRYPTHVERYYQDGQGYLANPGLQPETIRTAQAIWVRTWGGGIQSQVGWSESSWERLIEYEDDGNGLVQAQNKPGTTRGRAAEVELLGRHPGWTWMLQGGAYHWLRDDGARFPDSTRIQAGLRVTRIWGPWSLTGEARHVGRREDAALGVVAPAATTLRSALRWEGRQAWVSASMEDLTDARRMDLVALDYAPIARMASDGRTWRITLGWRF
ncbi:MAG: TonB-dependent receptor [Geothrix sp.]|nr:TonB-dependent receptor [Geothrix sp.]